MLSHKRSRKARDFWSDQRGGTAILFAVAAIPIMMMVGIAVDYARVIKFKAQVQAAVDATALATTTLVAGQGAPSTVVQPGVYQAQGNYASQATAYATNYFAAQAPANSIGMDWSNWSSLGSLTVQPSFFQNTATTMVSYQYNYPTAFSALFNQASINVTVKSTAQAVTPGGGGSPNSTGAQTYGGAGTIDGDPYVTGADGAFHDWVCSGTPSGTWYNLLSDAGMQVNATCDFAGGSGGETWWCMGAFNIVFLDTHGQQHTLYMIAPRNLSTGAPDFNNAWWGQITLDGVSYPAVAGPNWQANVTNYLGGMVQTSVSDTSDPYLGDNWVTVTTPHYTIKLSFDYQGFAAGDIRITATNAGACGVPGGILGGLLAGVWDNNTVDYSVASATTLAPQFAWNSTCATPTKNKAIAAHLIQ